MTLERGVKNGKPGAVRLTECPFCGTDLEERSRPDHLESCDEFQAWGAQELGPDGGAA